jgi:hypothetical protein
MKYFKDLNTNTKFWYHGKNTSGYFMKINDSQAIDVMNEDGSIIKFNDFDECYNKLEELIQDIKEPYKNKIKEMVDNVNDAMSDYLKDPFDFDADDLTRIINGIALEN